MSAAQVLLGMVELLVPGVAVLALLLWFVERGRRVPTSPREDAATQLHQQQARNSVGGYGSQN